MKQYRRMARRTMKRSHKRIVRMSLLLANFALLAAVVGFVLRNPTAGQTVRQNALINESIATNPLDELSSSDIAVHVAQMARLPESTAVVNQADTVSIQMALSTPDEAIVSKPQIVKTDTASYLDIKKYVVKSGDTLASLASKFGVTSDSIRWSNNLSGALQPGTTLYIPPEDGIVYVVKSGDTPDKLAREYGASKEAIISFNDAEVGGLKVGRRILIPGGTKTTTAYNFGASAGVGAAWGGAAIYGYNGYDYGWCTWYVANKLSVPANWGNANTWDNYASGAGWTVSSKPRKGAIAQTDRGYWGHVAYVEEVSADGKMMKYSDMNGLAGWGRAGYSDWVPVSSYPKYIYR